MYRDFPLPNHPDATPAAEAALCAHAQSRFWDYHDKIFENQRSLSDSSLRQFAVDLGLNSTELDKWTKCYDSRSFRTTVEKDFATGESLGVNSTPAFFINGRLLTGAQPIEAFRLIIDEEVEKHLNPT